MFTFILMLFYQTAQAKPFVYAGYGFSSFTDNAKSDLDMTIKKAPLKGGFGLRFGHLEFEIMYRQSSGEADFKHDNVKNSIVHKNTSIMTGIGIYTIPALRINGGIAFQSIKETLAEDVTAIQEESIKKKYNLNDGSGIGTYLGADFHLFTVFSAKFIVSGTAFFTSSIGGGKEYEAMAGIKIPFGGGGRSSGMNPLRSMSER